jgi:hypothetical protein
VDPKNCDAPKMLVVGALADFGPNDSMGRRVGTTESPEDEVIADTGES